MTLSGEDVFIRVCESGQVKQAPAAWGKHLYALVRPTSGKARAKGK